MSGGRKRRLRVAHVSLHLQWFASIARTRSAEARAGALLDGARWRVFVDSPEPRYAARGVILIRRRRPFVERMLEALGVREERRFFLARALTVNFLFQRLRHNRLVNRLSRVNDVVFVRYNSADVGAWLFLRRRGRLVFFHHTIAREEMRLQSRLGERVEALTARAHVRGTLAAGGVTDEIARLAASDVGAPDRWISIPNGLFVEPSAAAEVPRTGPLRVVMVASRFQTWHGLDELLDRVRAYAGPEDFEVVVAGGADDRLVERMKATPRVRFVGFLGPAPLEELVAKGDVGLAGLREDARGLSAMANLKVREYLAAGLPVLLGVRDAAVPDDFPYVRRLRPDWTLDDVLAFARASRGWTRPTVRDAAAPLIDYRHLLSAATDRLRGLGAGARADA